MDSQAKYGIIARGEVTLYLRVPFSAESEYKENIWTTPRLDHRRRGGRKGDGCHRASVRFFIWDKNGKK